MNLTMDLWTMTFEIIQSLVSVHRQMLKLKFK